MKLKAVSSYLVLKVSGPVLGHAGHLAVQLGVIVQGEAGVDEGSAHSERCLQLCQLVLNLREENIVQDRGETFTVCKSATLLPKAFLSLTQSRVNSNIASALANSSLAVPICGRYYMANQKINIPSLGAVGP